jgi:hypothetical protein
MDEAMDGAHVNMFRELSGLWSVLAPPQWPGFNASTVTVDFAAIHSILESNARALVLL